MHIIAYQPEHLQFLRLQPAQESSREFVQRAEYRRSLCAPGMAFTAFDDTCGRVIGCAGLVKIWDGRAEAWALLDADIKLRFLSLHNAVLRFLRTCGVRRVEANVDAGFDASIRWVEALGFERECLRRKFTPDGRDCYLYARVS